MARTIIYLHIYVVYLLQNNYCILLSRLQDAISVLHVAPVKIDMSHSRHTPSAIMMMSLVWLQEALFFDGRVDGTGEGRFKSFIVSKFLEHGNDFFDGRFRCAKCQIYANSRN